jgi:hypothetical protein
MTAKRLGTSRMTASVMSMPRSDSSARMRRPLSSVPVAPRYFARSPSDAHVHSVVAICPPQEIECAEMRIFALGPLGSG